MIKFRKAYTAAAVALAGGIGSAMLDGNLTLAEGVVAVGAALVAGAGVYKVTSPELVDVDQFTEV